MRKQQRDEHSACDLLRAWGKRSDGRENRDQEKWAAELCDQQGRYVGLNESRSRVGERGTQDSAPL